MHQIRNDVRASIAHYVRINTNESYTSSLQTAEFYMRFIDGHIKEKMALAMALTIDKTTQTEKDCEHV